MDHYASAIVTRLPARAANVDIVAVAPRRIEMLSTRELQKMLLKQKLPAKELPWLQPDFPLKNQGEGIGLREVTGLTSTVRTRTGALAASGSPSLPMPLEPPPRPDFTAEWQHISAKLAKLDFEAARRRAEFDTVKQTIANRRQEQNASFDAGTNPLPVFGFRPHVL
jgi:hypothetical protein